MSKQQAFKALDTFATSRVTLIKSMAAAGYTTLEDCRPIVIEWACAKTGATFTVKTVESTGEVVTRLDRDHVHYEKAKTTVRDITLMLRGTTRSAQTTSAKRDPAALLAIAFGKLSAKEQQSFYAITGIEQLMA
jgi:hypothetical protein